MLQLGNDKGNWIRRLVANDRSCNRLEQWLNAELIEVIFDSAADLGACSDQRRAGAINSGGHKERGNGP